MTECIDPADFFPDFPDALLLRRKRDAQRNELADSSRSARLILRCDHMITGARGTAQQLKPRCLTVPVFAFSALNASRVPVCFQVTSGVG